MVQMPRTDAIRGAICPLRNQKTPVSWDGGVGARLPASLKGAARVGGAEGPRGIGEGSDASTRRAQRSAKRGPRQR